MRKIIFILGIITISISISFAQKVGEPAPEIAGNGFNGNKISLSDFKGKVIILDFWASWCGPCRKEIPFLVKLSDELKNKDVKILAVNEDKKAEAANKFIEKLEKQPVFPIIWDKDNEFPPKYLVDAMPTTFFIDKKGIVRFIHVGFKDSFEKDYRDEINQLLEEK
jgi:thiol-disulfide isomerase/thioredoxin